jgi:hypothetical protein
MAGRPSGPASCVGIVSGQHWRTQRAGLRESMRSGIASHRGGLLAGSSPTPSLRMGRPLKTEAAKCAIRGLVGDGNPACDSQRATPMCRAG